MKYVALDIGNVLVRVNSQRFLNKLSKSLNISLEEATYFLNRTQKLHDLGYTKISDELRDHFKIRSSVLINELLEEWNYIVQPADYILDIFNNIRQQEPLKIALLSNIGVEHMALMPQLLGQGDFYDQTIKYFSCQVGARKPSMIYYHTFLELYPNFKGCTYIDDLSENLAVGQQFGFKPFHFSLQDIVDNNYEETKYLSTIEKMKNAILDQPEIINCRWH